MENNLNTLSTYLTNIEQHITKQEVYYVDISPIFSEQITIIKTYNKLDNFKKFTELVEIIEKIDEQKLTSKTPNVQSSINQTKNLNSPQISNTNKTVSKQFNSQINHQNNIQINQSNLIIKQKLYPIPINSEIESIEQELEKSLGKESQQFLQTQTNTTIKNEIINKKKQNIKTNNSVLIKLSIQDQISEMEKIIKGLNLNYFNKQQIEIIKKEADSLKFYINKQEKSNNTNFNLNLVNLRKARLNLVLSLLYN